MNPSELTHNELIKSVAQEPENQGVWSEFYNRFHKYICFNIYDVFKKNGYTGEGTHVENVAQDIYMILLNNECRALKNFRGDYENAIFKYLGIIARHEANKYLKESNRFAHISLDSPLPGDHNTTMLEVLDQDKEYSELTSSEIREETEFCLNRILKKSRHMDRDKLLFKYYYFDHIKVEEIPQYLNTNLSAKRIWNILNYIKQRIVVCMKSRLVSYYASEEYES